MDHIIFFFKYPLYKQIFLGRQLFKLKIVMISRGHNVYVLCDLKNTEKKWINEI